MDIPDPQVTGPVKMKKLAIEIGGDQCRSALDEIAVRRELAQWRKVSHCNVVSVFGVFYRDLTPFLVTSWIVGKNLNVFFRENDHLSPLHRMRMILNVASGLEYLHESSIVHGHLTGANVIINEEMLPVLTDFGLTSVRGPMQGSAFLRTSSDAPGAIRWAATELITKEVESPTIHSDIYSFGSIALQVATGKVPWSELDDDFNVVVQLSQGLVPPRPKDSWINDALWAFIESCWEFVPEDRPNSANAHIVMQRESLALLRTHNECPTDKANPAVTDRRYSLQKRGSIRDLPSDRSVPLPDAAIQPESTRHVSVPGAKQARRKAAIDRLPQPIVSDRSFTSVNNSPPTPRSSTKLSRDLDIHLDSDWMESEEETHASSSLGVASKGDEKVGDANRAWQSSSSNWVGTSLRARRALQAQLDSSEMVEQKIMVLLDKLTDESFDSISDQIIDLMNKNVNEKGGWTLIQVSRLVYEKAMGDARSAMYARLCRKMMEQTSQGAQVDGIKTMEGKTIIGGQLFLKYLLDWCQDDFEHGLLAKESNEYYALPTAKHQVLINFICELFKLHMLTAHIMHECVEKLLGNAEKTRGRGN